ncbi:MAG: DMT family transporter [Pseudomonadota bacterium]
MNTVTLHMGGRQWATLIGLSLLWGGSFFFVDIAVRELSALWTVALRVLIAGTVMAAFMALTGRLNASVLPLTPKLAGEFLVMGFLSNALPFTLIAWGQIQIASGLASMINAATPIFTMIVAGLLLADERFTLLRILGAIVGAVGVGTMIGPSVLDAASTPLLPQLACLSATLSYAFGTVFGRRFTNAGLDPQAIALGQLLGSTALLVPLVLVLEGPIDIARLSEATVGAIGALSIASTALAYLLFFRLLAEAGATNTVLVTLLVPVSATALGVVFLAEPLIEYQLVGVTIVAFGLSLIDGRLWRRRAAAAGTPRTG